MICCLFQSRNEIIFSLPRNKRTHNGKTMCYFVVPGGENRDRAIYLDMKHGSDTKDYDKIAQAEKLKPLEKELRRLEDLSESIVNDFAYMRAREEEMRDTNGW